jgi:hypothetical protein
MNRAQRPRPQGEPEPIDDDLTGEPTVPIQPSPEQLAMDMLTKAENTAGVEGALLKWVPVGVLVLICLIIAGIVGASGAWIIAHILKAAF